ncbi:ATP-grasp domain-containing protein [Streptacidiphilus cavernicola]|uniref:Acetyl-CoA carboxylase biotin carboxylase subunit family protein n=1 Tax=Streptacidiphilus cavernicola TaxID=3342716 RepID=A0ABV6VYS2_9ACTN
MSGPLAGAFVQLGATRDGLDPYLSCARRRGLPAVLVETPAYLRWRRALGRQPFDLEVPVEQPQDAARVRAALAAARVRPSLLLTGFERYAQAGFELARSLEAAPWPQCGAEFRPLDKQRQREALAASCAGLPQPRFALVAAGRPVEDLGYPQVLKPVDGGGGLGVLLADSPSAAARALARIAALSNYGGGAFTAVMAEEFVKGPEVSLQGIAYQGEPVLLSVCEKITALEEVADDPDLRGFREVGHVARPGTTATADLRELARLCLAATGYRQGPFHVDAILGGAGPVFVEMGFRLSGGGLVSLVEQATGTDWAAEVFRVHLDGTAPRLGQSRPGSGAAGQVAVVSAAELDAAAALAGPGISVQVQPSAAPPTDGLSAADLDVLGSDLMRHTGSIGRVVLVGGRPDEIHRRLESLVLTRKAG